MPEMNELADEMAAALNVNDDDATDDDQVVDDDQQDDEVDDTQEDDTEEDDDTQDSGEGDDEQADTEEDESDDEDDAYEVNEDEPEPGEVKEPPKLDNEAEYILSKLPKIKTNILVRGADGKSAQREVEVYGWGQLLAIPGYDGFATKVDEGSFIANAQNNENRAKELQGEFLNAKATQDADAYTQLENRGIAKDLADLRRDGLFPKFKGVPGSRDWNQSQGAQVFDEVVTFMNEQNDLALQESNQNNGAYYHISFKQAFRMLYPQLFDTKSIETRRANERRMARRTKSGGGTERTTQPKRTQRVTNINDLAGEFTALTGGNS